MGFSFGDGDTISFGDVTTSTTNHHTLSFSSKFYHRLCNISHAPTHSWDNSAQRQPQNINCNQPMNVEEKSSASTDIDINTHKVTRTMTKKPKKCNKQHIQNDKKLQNQFQHKEAVINTANERIPNILRTFNIISFKFSLDSPHTSTTNESSSSSSGSSMSSSSSFPSNFCNSSDVT